MMKISIREETPDDAAAIDQLLRSAFDGNYEARLVTLLRDTGKLGRSTSVDQPAAAINGLSLVAVHDDEIVGTIQFSQIALNAIPQPAHGLAPVAVVERCRRQGIAADLVEAGLEMIRQMGSTFVVVLGDPAYYMRFGFQPASSFGLDSIYNAGDAFMAMPLGAGSSEMPSGLVTYDEAFEVVANPEE